MVNKKERFISHMLFPYSIMELVQIADTTSTGYTNDHIELMVDTTRGDDLPSSAYLRRNFERGDGPRRPQTRAVHRVVEKYYTPGERREIGWKDCSTVFSDVPYSNALGQAMARAQEENVVLYERRPGPGDITIKWKPDGWEPEQEELDLSKLYAKLEPIRRAFLRIHPCAGPGGDSHMRRRPPKK